MQLFTDPETGQSRFPVYAKSEGKVKAHISFLQHTDANGQKYQYEFDPRRESLDIAMTRMRKKLIGRGVKVDIFNA